MSVTEETVDSVYEIVERRQAVGLDVFHDALVGLTESFKPDADMSSVLSLVLQVQNLLWSREFVDNFPEVPDEAMYVLVDRMLRKHVLEYLSPLVD